MDKDLGYTQHMGPRLRAEAERQLLHDFHRYYHGNMDNLAIDWSDTCPEGHTTEYLDGRLEDWSGVRMKLLHRAGLSSFMGAEIIRSSSFGITWISEKILRML